MSTALPLPRLGVDLLADETQMPAGAVRAAVNVDIDRTGQFRRRAGWAGALPGTFSRVREWGGALLAQRGAQLLRVDVDSLAYEVLLELPDARPLDFSEYLGRLYCCHPTGLWYAPRGSFALRPAGVRLPDVLPSVRASDAGALTPGRYSVALSLVAPDGEESPAALLGGLQLQAGLVLEGLPVLPEMRWRVYLTPPDGDVLYLAEEFAALLPQYAVGSYPQGAPCEVLQRACLPGGQFVRGWAGRLYVARGDTLWYSDAMRPHLTAPQHGFMQFVGAIRMVEFVAGGAYVGDERGVWWLSGDDPTSWRVQPASGAQPLMRSGTQVAGYLLGVMGTKSSADHALWLSTEGYMVGAPDGSVTALHSDRIRIAPGQAGRSVFLQRDGVAQVVTLTASPGPAHVFGAAEDLTKGISP